MIDGPSLAAYAAAQLMVIAIIIALLAITAGVLIGAYFW